MELYEGACELKLLDRLEGHSDRVWSLAWNPATGSAGVPLVFASCSGDKTVRVWEHAPSPSSGSWTCKVRPLYIYLLSIFRFIGLRNFDNDLM
jgi:WD40 repeat protein